MRDSHNERTFLTLLFAAVLPLEAAQFPIAGEALHYTINWPSGLSLGEAHLRAQRNDGNWQFEFALDAAVPGFAVADRYRSLVTSDLCSLELEKGASHGSRRIRERTAFDYRRNVARRATVKGGKNQFPIQACARDALAFVFYARGELAQGRVPPETTIFFGSPYRVKLDWDSAQTVRVNDQSMQADRILVSVKGPASGFNFEIYYARDAARTPVMVKVPLPLGVVSMELVR